MSDHSYSETKPYTRRPLRDLNVIDDFLFTSMLTEDGIAVPFSKRNCSESVLNSYARGAASHSNAPRAGEIHFTGTPSAASASGCSE